MFSNADFHPIITKNEDWPLKKPITVYVDWLKITALLVHRNTMVQNLDRGIEVWWWMIKK